MLLLLPTLVFACLPLLILVEYIFESTNSQTIVLGGVVCYPPAYYLEKMELFSKRFCSNAAIFLAKTINYVYLLEIPMYLFKLWSCIKKVTKLIFKTVMPLEDFRSNFLATLNPEVIQFNPKLTRSKRQLSLNVDEDMLNSTIFTNLNEQNKEIFEKLQNPSTREVDEKTRKEIEEFTEGTDNHSLKGTNIDSSTNVLGMDKIYRLGDVDPAVNPSHAHDDIIRKGLNNKYSWGDSSDDIKEPVPKEVEESHDGCKHPVVDRDEFLRSYLGVK